MKRYKSFVGYIVVALTIAVFSLYIRTHPEVIDQLRATKLSTVLAVIGLYGAMTAVLVVIYGLLLKICGVAIPAKDNILLTMYSSVVNFFGPLQSGPGFRMVYLKKRFGIGMVKYFGASLLYYAIFAVVSGLFLLSGIIGLLGMAGLLAGWGLLAWLVLLRVAKHKRFKAILPQYVTLQNISFLALATLVQLV